MSTTKKFSEYAHIAADLDALDEFLVWDNSTESVRSVLPADIKKNILGSSSVSVGPSNPQNDGDIVTRGGIQDLTNKTITAATIGGGTIDDATITDSTLTGATITAPTVTSPAITGTTTIGSGATITSPTITSPTITGTTSISGTTTIGTGATITSPTITSPTITGGSLSATTTLNGTTIASQLDAKVGASGSTLTGATLTSPTLTTPIISTFYKTSGANLITVPEPTVADTVVLRTQSQTLTNKTLTEPTLTDAKLSGTSTTIGTGATLTAPKINGGVIDSTTTFDGDTLATLLALKADLDTQITHCCTKKLDNGAGTTDSVSEAEIFTALDIAALTAAGYDILAATIGMTLYMVDTGTHVVVPIDNSTITATVIYSGSGADALLTRIDFTGLTGTEVYYLALTFKIIAQA